MKEWDLLTIERNGEMLISAKRGGGVNDEMKEICPPQLGLQK